MLLGQWAMRVRPAMLTVPPVWLTAPGTLLLSPTMNSVPLALSTALSWMVSVLGPPPKFQSPTETLPVTVVTELPPSVAAPAATLSPRPPMFITPVPSTISVPLPPALRWLTWMPGTVACPPV